MKIDITDNVLSEETFKKIQEELLGPWFPWSYNSYIVYPSTDLNNFQFTHSFYKEYRSTSDYIELLHPIIDIINPSAIVRIKANLLPKTENIVLSDLHTDADNFDGKISIFYINTNNGYTLFENGNTVSSIENRMITFDPTIKHCGSTCTDQKVRIVINLMYYTWIN